MDDILFFGSILKFFRKRNILISQPLRRLMHIAVPYYKFQKTGPRSLKTEVLRQSAHILPDVVALSRIKMPHTSSSCQSERLLMPETAAAVRDRPPLYHAGHHLPCRPPRQLRGRNWRMAPPNRNPPLPSRCEALQSPRQRPLPDRTPPLSTLQT
jgi:hypothetical protein